MPWCSVGICPTCLSAVFNTKPPVFDGVGPPVNSGLKQHQCLATLESAGWVEPKTAPLFLSRAELRPVARQAGK